MTNRSNHWLLVAAALLGVALLIPIVSAHGGLTAVVTTDDTAQEWSPDTADHRDPMVDNRSGVTDSDRPGHDPMDPEHHHGSWVNGTYHGEWTNETYGPHGSMHHGSWVNGTYYGEWANETYGPNGPWTDESQDGDVWTNATDGSATRTGDHHRGPGGCR